MVRRTRSVPATSSFPKQRDHGLRYGSVLADPIPLVYVCLNNLKVDHRSLTWPRQYFPFSVKASPDAPMRRFSAPTRLRVSGQRCGTVRVELIGTGGVFRRRNKVQDRKVVENRVGKCPGFCFNMVNL